MRFKRSKAAPGIPVSLAVMSAMLMQVGASMPGFPRVRLPPNDLSAIEAARAKRERRAARNARAFK